jgi:hypothetical protein
MHPVAPTTLTPGRTFYVCCGPWAKPHFRRGEYTSHLVLGWFSIGWLRFNVGPTLAILMQRVVAAENATKDARLHLIMVLDDWRVFRAWLESHPAEAPIELPDDQHLLEHYLRTHGVPDAECQCECGRRECDGCGVNGCDGGWQNMRWFGLAHEMSSWMFYDVIGSEIDVAKTWGEALEAFDHALAVARWARGDDPDAPNPYLKEVVAGE